MNNFVVDKLFIRGEMMKLRWTIMSYWRSGSYNPSSLEHAYYMIAKEHYPDLLSIIEEVSSRYSPSGGATFYCKK
jgi:hypothetical protein